MALWGLSEGKGVWRKERSERHQRTLKPFSRNQSSLRHHSKPSTLRRHTESSGKKKKKEAGPKAATQSVKRPFASAHCACKAPGSLRKRGCTPASAVPTAFSALLPRFFFLRRARARARRACCARRRARERGRERPTRGETGRKQERKAGRGRKRGQKAGFFFFGPQAAQA